MNVYVVSYRDEFRPDPVELAAFEKRERADQTVEELVAMRQDLARKGLPEGEMNKVWREFLIDEGIPENKFVVLDLFRYGNYAFKVNELEIIR